MFWGLKGMARAVSRKYSSGEVKIALAESCTGGLAAAMLTVLPGVSLFFQGSTVVYSNDLKRSLLDVPADLLETWGAVSQQTAASMAQGLSRVSGAQISLSVTGIAGPGGGSLEKPVGLVWFSWHSEGKTRTWSRNFGGGRNRIQKLAVRELFTALLEGPPVDSSLT